MRKEWFEPGPDGVILFVKLLREAVEGGALFSEAISAAFRALLAAEVEEPPALQVGDVVRLEAWDGANDSAIGHEGRIYRFNVDGRVGVEPHWMWPRTALTLIRRAGEVDKDAEIALLTDERDAARAEVSARNSIIDGLRSDVERWKSIADALQSRIDAGDQVWIRRHNMFGYLLIDEDPKFGGSPRILIDARPIDQPDHIVEPNKMVDERKGPADRRETSYTESLKSFRWEVRGDMGRDGIIGYGGDISRACSNDRRSTPGTLADRGKL